MEKKDQTWNSSRGITFAGDVSRRGVSYPQLPSLATYHSESGVSTASTNPEPVLPLNDASGILGNPAATGTTLDSQGQEFVDAQEVLEEEQAEVIVQDENVQSKDKDTSLKPPFTPLSFTMTEELFKKAKKARKGSPNSYWTYNLYRGPDKDGNLSEKVKVHYCRSANTTERVLKQYFMDDKILGLDLEWEPNAKATDSPRQNVSVIQIASERRIGIFHISLYPRKDELASPLLKQIIEDPEIIKTGVWILGDCTKLEKYLGIKGRGIQELSHLYKLVKYSKSGEHELVNRNGVPLAKMVNEVLHLPMFKGSVRTSAWSKTLNMEQILYSASDAYAGVQLFAMMDHQRKQLNPTPPLPYPAELKLPIRLAADVILEEAGMLDEPLPDETANDASLSADYLSSVGDNINVEIEGDGSTTLSSEDTKTTTKKPRTKTAATDPTAPAGESSSTTATKRKRTLPWDPTKPKVIDPLIAEANLWAQNYLLARQPPKPKPEPQPTQQPTPTKPADTPQTTTTTPPPPVKPKKYIRPPLSVAYLRAYYLWSRNPSLNAEALAALLGIKTRTAIEYILRAVTVEKGRLGFEPKRMRAELLGCGALTAEDLSWRWKSVMGLCELYEEAERRLEMGLGEQGQEGQGQEQALDEIFAGQEEEEGEVVEGEGGEEAEAEVKEDVKKKDVKEETAEDVIRAALEVKEETAEDVIKAALEAVDDGFDMEGLDGELNNISSSQETVDLEEAQRLRKMSRSH